jgi:CheY-like chemotaxis protein
LGEIGDSSAYPAMRKLLSEHPADSNVRFAAYEALGTISAQGGAHILGNGLTDPEEQVRVAAAGAIERNLSDLLIAGINNMLQSGPEEKSHICTAIINARAVNTFLALFKTEEFRKEATRFLIKNAPDDLRNLFATKLENNGYQEAAEEISKSARPLAARSRALAVDDSRMILNIYKTTLFNLGYDPVLFSRPDKALEWLKDNKPRVMFTDLNMPEMTGVELIRKTRELYSSSRLPIVMITTQNEVQDNRDAIQAGADTIGRKPFTSESLQNILENLEKSTEE